MADLNFSQPERRNLATPILIAVVVLAVVAILVFTLSPRTTAEVAILKTAVYNAHTVFKSESTIVGRDPSQDDLYVLLDVRIEDRLNLPLFLKDFTAILTPSSPDGSPAEDIPATAIEKLDIPNLYTSFPALKALADEQAAPLLLRETQIAPGKSAQGLILLHFPTAQANWDARKSATLTITPYHQSPLTLEIPKSKP